MRRVLIIFLVALGHPRQHGPHGCWTGAMRPIEVKTTQPLTSLVQSRRLGEYLCFPRPLSKRGAPVDGATTTVVGILGDDPLVSRILGLLLRGLATRRAPWMRPPSWRTRAWRWRV